MEWTPNACFCMDPYGRYVDGPGGPGDASEPCWADVHFIADLILRPLFRTMPGARLAVAWSPRFPQVEKGADINLIDAYGESLLVKSLRAKRLDLVPPGGRGLGSAARMVLRALVVVVWRASGRVSSCCRAEHGKHILKHNRLHSRDPEVRIIAADIFLLSTVVARDRR